MERDLTDDCFLKQDGPRSEATAIESLWSSHRCGVLDFGSVGIRFILSLKNHWIGPNTHQLRHIMGLTGTDEGFQELRPDNNPFTG